MASGKDLVGVWRLVSCEQLLESGERKLPFGPGPRGFLIYAESGFMVAHLMARKRPARASSDTERLEAMRTYQSYGGRYSFDGTTVTHHVEVGLQPGDVGEDKARKVELDEDTLVLSARSPEGGKPVYEARVEWRRARAEG
jgi:hypothetical protein